MKRNAPASPQDQHCSSRNGFPYLQKRSTEKNSTRGILRKKKKIQCEINFGSLPLYLLDWALHLKYNSAFQAEVGHRDTEADLEPSHQNFHLGGPAAQHPLGILHPSFSLDWLALTRAGPVTTHTNTHTDTQACAHAHTFPGPLQKDANNLLLTLCVLLLNRVTHPVSKH